MTNKEIVLDFYKNVFNKWDLSSIDKYMKEDYIQHNPKVKNCKSGFIEFANGFFTKKPHVDIYKILEDNDMVCVFFKCSFCDGTIAKVFDMYRLEDGMLAEHWDSVMRVDDLECVHSNGHF